MTSSKHVCGSQRALWQARLSAPRPPHAPLTLCTSSPGGGPVATFQPMSSCQASNTMHHQPCNMVLACPCSTCMSKANAPGSPCSEVLTWHVQLRAGARPPARPSRAAKRPPQPKSAAWACVALGQQAAGSHGVHHCLDRLHAVLFQAQRHGQRAAATGCALRSGREQRACEFRAGGRPPCAALPSDPLGPPRALTWCSRPPPPAQQAAAPPA